MKALLLFLAACATPLAVADTYLCLGEETAVIEHTYGTEPADILSAESHTSTDKFVVREEGVFFFGSDAPIFSFSCAVRQGYIMKCGAGDNYFNIFSNNVFLTHFIWTAEDVKQGYARSTSIAGKCSKI